MNQTIEFATAQPKELSTEVYASLVDTIDIPSDKMQIPRVSLLQGISKAVMNDGLKVGNFYNSVTKEDYGETILFIPLKPAFGALYMKKGEGLVCKSVDGVTSMHGDKCAKCPFGVYYKTWSQDGKPPACSETIDILGIEATTLQPSIITFKSYGYPTGKQLITNLKLIREAMAFRIGSTKTENDSGIFFVPKLKGQLKLTPEQYEAALNWKTSLKSTSYDVAEDEDAHT